LPEGIAIHHRDDLDTVQREFRELKGTTVIIYDQTCATEKRRRRKRGTLAAPATTVVINEAVCEGCGDCGVQSNCLSIEPLETEFGRKRTINQSSCNKDVSCVKGFCPSFVTVEGTPKKKGAASTVAPKPMADLPDPIQQPLTDVCGMVVAGVGGTGVITIGQLLGVAAHIEGKGIVTQDAAGLAQKGGGTWSHVLIGPTQASICTTRVGMAAADLVLGCDPIVAAGKDTLLRMLPGRTKVALNSSSTPTAAFVTNGDWQNPSEACVASISQSVAPADLGLFNADAMASTLMGDTLYINPMLLGYAWQKGWIPLGKAALMRAIELNAVAVDANKAAFNWGRQAAHDWPSVQRLLVPTQTITLHKRETLEQVVARRVEFLTAYQNAAYATQYQHWVDKVRAAEAPLGHTRLTDTVARNLFKLMAYKDEYEVARLHTDAAFDQKLAGMFEEGFKVKHHLAPPLLAKTNTRGELVKQVYGPAVRTAMRWLAPLKTLRGSAWDVFGRTDERRMERKLIADYQGTLTELTARLNADNHALAVDLARVPDAIKGFGHVKARNAQVAQARWVMLLNQWKNHN
jgi:indolepyruvate ferredoxin oxidoreductase